MELIQLCGTSDAAKWEKLYLPRLRQAANVTAKIPRHTPSSSLVIQSLSYSPGINTNISETSNIFITLYIGFIVAWNNIWCKGSTWPEGGGGRLRKQESIYSNTHFAVGEMFSFGNYLNYNTLVKFSKMLHEVVGLSK